MSSTRKVDDLATVVSGARVKPACSDSNLGLAFTPPEWISETHSSRGTVPRSCPLSGEGFPAEVPAGSTRRPPPALPGIHGEPGNPGEVTDVSRDDGLSREVRDCTDQGVHVPHGPPLAFEIFHDAPVLLSRGTVQRKDGERGQNGSHAGKGAHGITREVGPSEEFGDIDRSRGDRFASAREDRELAQCVGMAPNQTDEAIGVEDRH